MIYKKQQAFTLVELVVVITILAILWTIALMSLQWYSISARDSTRIIDISSIKTSLELFQLDAWKYPLPTDGVNITYSWWVVWKQWTFWKTVFSNVDRLDKKPTDPLTGKEYTYSSTYNRNDYEIWWIIEWDEISLYNWILETNAWEITATALVTWNYNGQMSKILSWTNCNVLSIPTIITNDTDISTDLEEIVTNKRLVYSWYKNLPSSFKWSKFKYNWWFDYTPVKLIAYSDTSSCENLKSKSSYIERLQLLKWLQDSYSGTILKEHWKIKNILSLDINLSSPNQELINYAGNYVNNTLWWKIIINNTITTNNCIKTTQSWYTIPQLNDLVSNQEVTKVITNWTKSIKVSCNNWILIYWETETTNCNLNYILSWNVCLLDTCTWTIPTNAVLNGNQWTAMWTYSTTPWVCKYTNNVWFHTENLWISFVSDTRSCIITNGWWEQTWNWSSWDWCIVKTCDTDFYQTTNTCSAVWTWYYSANSSLTRTDCSNKPANTSTYTYSYTSDWNWTNSCSYSTTQNCWLDSYALWSNCYAVWTWYYSPSWNNTRYSCSNKPVNSLYTSDWNWSNNCGFSCNNNYTYSWGTCQKYFSQKSLWNYRPSPTLAWYYWSDTGSAYYSNWAWHVKITCSSHVLTWNYFCSSWYSNWTSLSCTSLYSSWCYNISIQILNSTWTSPWITVCWWDAHRCSTSYPW